MSNKQNKINSFIYSLFILSCLSINEVSSSTTDCSLGCSECSVSSQSQQLACTQCKDDFQLYNERCKYSKCSANTYLQYSKVESQNGAIVENYECKAICDNPYYENVELNVCDKLEQCTVSYSSTNGSSTSVGTIESIYKVNDEITIIIYPTYVTFINAVTGQYLREVTSQTTISTLYFKNYLIILTTNNQIMEWIFDSNFYRLIATIQLGKLSTKSSFFSLSNDTVYAVSTLDESLSVIYFQTIYLDAVSSAQQVNAVGVSFSYVGCALQIVDVYLICIGRDSKIIVKKLLFSNQLLRLEDLTQSTSCLNSSFSSNNILQSIIMTQDNTSSTILLIQALNTNLIQLIDDQVGVKLQCKLNNLLVQPEKMKLVQQQDRDFLLAVKFAKSVTIYDQQIGNGYQLTSGNYITDIMFVQDKAANSPTIYKMFAMTSGLNVLISTYSVDIVGKTISLLKQFPAQIINALLFLTYNNKDIQNNSLSTLFNDDHLFIANQNLQSINAFTDQTNFIVSPFAPKKIGHTDAINDMAYSDQSIYLLTCSQDGQIIAWYTLTSLNPTFLYQVSQNSEYCRSVFIHNNIWGVALFSRSILIFQLKNAFIRYSYAFSNPATDVSQFISHIQSNILLFYDSQFILLQGSDLSQISIGAYNPSSKIISLLFAQDYSIIVQSDVNTLEVYQFDQKSLYAFSKVTNKKYISNYGEFATVSLDYISNSATPSDYEILLGCKLKAFVALNSSLVEVFVHQVSQGYPMLIQKYSDNNLYIIFGYSLEGGSGYLYFHYAVDRNANVGQLYSRSYSLKHNLGLHPVQDYKGNTNVNYLATMPFSYFTLILTGIYRPLDKSINYGYFIYLIGQPITKYSVKDDGKIQYYGSKDGILSFSTNQFQCISSLNLNPIVANTISDVKASAFLQSLFVVSNEVDVYNIYTHAFQSQIQFNSLYSSQKVIRLIISEKYSIAIAFKSAQLIVRNFIDNSDKTITSVSLINGVLLDEQNQKLYIYGSSLKVVNLDLTNEVIITKEGQTTYQQCNITTNLIICRTNGATLTILNKLTYVTISNTVILNQSNFAIYLDEANSQIYLATTSISVFDFSGILMSKIDTTSLAVNNIQIFGNHLAVLTSTYIFIFTRKDLTLMKYFKPSGGGNIMGYYYIADYNLIAYYADEIRYGQLFYFSLNNYLDDGFSLGSYPELGLGSVVTLFYDTYTSRLNYIDSQGVLYSVNFLSQRSFYNVMLFEQFKDLSSPTNYALDPIFNTIYVYNKSFILKMNFNIISQYVIQQSEKSERLYFKYLPSTSTLKADTTYYIFDKYNVLYSYKDFAQIYQTYFSNPVRNVKQLAKYQLIVIIFDDQMLLYSYHQVQTKQIQPDSYIAKISNPKVRRFFTDELLLTTEQELIHINYLFYNDGTNNWKKKVISYSQNDEFLRNFLKYGLVGEEKVLISFNSGRVVFYDQSTQIDQVIVAPWTAQGSVTTNFVKYFSKSASYLVLGYQYNYISVLALTNFAIIKTIDMTALTSQADNSCNLVFIDETNNRLFVSMVYSKLIYVLKLTSLDLQSYLSFPNDQYNRMTMTDNFIFTYSIFQVNIFRRDTLRFVNSIKKSSSENRILTLNIIDSNKIILAMNVVLEVYLLDEDDGSLQTIDSSAISNTEIVDAYINESDANILMIVGISDTSIIDKRINIQMFTSAAQSTSNQVVRYQCYSQISMNDRIVGENIFQNIYNTNINNRDYRIAAQFSQAIKSIDFIPDSNIRVVILPDTSNTNSTLNVFDSSLAYLKRTTLSFSHLSFNFQLNNVNYSFSPITKNVVWQNIKIVSQNLRNVQIIFSGMSSISISELSIQSINYSYTGESSSIDQFSQSLLLFVDCNSITIDRLIVDNLNLSNASLLLAFQRVSNVQINVMSVTQSIFYQLMYVEKADTLSLNALTITNNHIDNTLINGNNNNNNTNLLFMISIAACTTTTLSQISINSNTDILLFQYTNTYSNANEKVILYNDSLTIQNAIVYDTITTVDSQTTTSKLLIRSLISIQATSVVFTNVQYNLNHGNIQIANSKTISISHSQFQQNESLEGGAIYFNTISDNISMVNATFSKNIATGGGGALFLKDTLSITFDSKSSVIGNQAQIGGGIRIVNTQSNPYQVLKDTSKIKGNKAEIYGQNIGIYPTQLKVILNSASSSSRLRQLEYQSDNQQNITDSKHKQTDQIQNEKNQIFNSNQSLRNSEISFVYEIKKYERKGSREYRRLTNSINIDDFRSGDYLPLSVLLLDDDANIVSFSISKLRDQSYTSEILQEIKSFGFEIQLVDSVNTQVSGQQFLNYNQFNEELKQFQFQSLKISAHPLSLRSVNLISTSDYNTIEMRININFRSCRRGEIFKSITESIITCDVCQSGFYSLKDPVSTIPLTDQSQAFSCMKCPSSADRCEADQIVLRDGYWRESVNTDEIYECDNERFTSSCKESDSQSIKGCIQGYSGPLCENCDERGELWGKRYTFMQADQSCQSCDDTYLYYSYFLIVSLALIFYLSLSVIMFVNNFIFHSTSSYLRYMKIVPMSASCLNDQSTFYMKSLINYLQISSMLLQFNLKSHFTIFLNSTSYIGSPSTKVLADSHCLYSDRMIKNYGVTQIKIFVEAIYPIIFLFFIGSCFYVCARLKIFGIKMYHNYSTLTILFTFFQPELVRYFTEALSCRKIGDKRYVSLNLLIECQNSNYTVFSNTFIIPYLTLLLIIPFFALKALYQHRKTLNYCLTKYKFGYFYLDYKPNLFFWEFIRIYLKTFIVVFYTLYKETDQSFAYQIISLLLCFSLILNHIYKPFMQQQALKVESASIVVLILNIILQQLDLLHQSTPIKILEYLSHTFYFFTICLIILHHKLNKKQQGKIIYVRNLFKYCLPKRVFNIIFTTRNSLMPTYFRWIQIKKSINAITKVQAQKVQQLCDTNVSKYITNSCNKFQNFIKIIIFQFSSIKTSKERIPMLKVLVKKDQDLIASQSPFTMNPRTNFDLNSLLQNQNALLLRNTYSTNLSPIRINNVKNIDQIFGQIKEQATIQREKSNDQDHEHTINDIDNVSQYDEQPYSLRQQKNIPVDSNIELSAITRK